MAEIFTNSFTRAAGIVTSSSNASFAAAATTITGISTTNIQVGSLVDNVHFIGGTKVTAVGTGEVTVDIQSTNTSTVTGTIVSFLGVTTSYVATNKSVLIGGTLSNLTQGQIEATIQVASGSTAYNLLYGVPVPAGSSLVVSDAGKTLLQPGDRINLAVNANNSADLSLSILDGVN